MRKINFKLNDSALNQFGLKRKRLVSSYNNTTESIQSIRKQSVSSRDSKSLVDLTMYTSGDQLDRFFTNPGKNNEQVITLSNSLYQTNLIYQKIIDYYRNMYYWRYVVTPRRLVIEEDSKKPNKKEYGKIYHEMLETVDGISIETVFPKILLELFKNGQVFLYARGDKTSRTVSTILLPNKYCRTGLKTQHGTIEVDFDFSYFDSLGLNEEEKVALLAVFPKEFVRLYDNYVANKSLRWQTLNPKVSTCIRMNEVGFPSFLSLFYDIIDYKTYKLNELDKSTNKLERLVTQEIDLDKSGLELPEVEQLHASMADVICQNKGSTLVTSVGKIAVHQLQEDDSVQNESLNQAYNNIYNNAGINYNLFNGSIAESLDVSIKRDLSFVWTYVELLVNFYNLALNNLINFKGYQLSLRILPISPFNETEKLSGFHQNAEYGVGLIDLVVASGIKQVDLESTLEMEEYLDLSNRLVPLSSSHTLSSTDVANKKSGKDSKSTDESNSEKTSTDKNEEANDEADKSKDSNIKK